jgi:hypothetical protein
VALLDKALLNAIVAMLAAEEKSFLGKIKLREVCFVAVNLILFFSLLMYLSVV